MKSLLIKCEGAGHVDIDELHEFQGDLKELSKENYAKLRKVLETEGFCDPINVWEHPDSKKLYILDGHQRTRTLKMMRDDGWAINKLPVNFVRAKDQTEAKKLVLTFSSSYGRITDESLSQFVIDAGISYDFLQAEVAIAEVDIELEGSEPPPTREIKLRVSGSDDSLADLERELLQRGFHCEIK